MAVFVDSQLSMCGEDAVGCEKVRPAKSTLSPWWVLDSSRSSCVTFVAVEAIPV